MNAIERRKKRRSLAKRTKSLVGKIRALEELGVHTAYYISDPESGKQWTHNLETLPAINGRAFTQSAHKHVTQPTEGEAAEHHVDHLRKGASTKPSPATTDWTEEDVIGAGSPSSGIGPSGAVAPPPSWQALVRCFVQS